MNIKEGSIVTVKGAIGTTGNWRAPGCKFWKVIKIASSVSYGGYRADLMPVDDSHPRKTPLRVAAVLLQVVDHPPINA